MHIVTARLYPSAYFTFRPRYLYQSCNFNLKNYMNDIRPFIHTSNDDKFPVISVLSYNVLAQELLTENSFLYDWSDKSVLEWEYRRGLLLDEIRQFNADIICFQEVQESHLNWFDENLSDLGYNGVYKKRTHNNSDGCAIYFKNAKFTLQETVTVEFYQPKISVLDRDNVGIVLRLSPRKNEKENLIISTTHILFNRTRHDTKLAQVHLLLAEIERVSYKGHRRIGHRIIPMYHPTILTGDFNLDPTSAVYHFLTNGALHYSNLQKPTLKFQEFRSSRPNMGNELIPKSLAITENSQHANVLELRKQYNYKRQTNDSLFSKLYHSQNKNNQQSTLPLCEFRSGTGNLYHGLNFSSVYDNTSCSTHQDSWKIVDYIFYTSTNLKLKSYMKLPCSDECQQIKKLPNKVSPSDHLPLFALFNYPLYD